MEDLLASFGRAGPSPLDRFLKKRPVSPAASTASSSKRVKTDPSTIKVPRPPAKAVKRAPASGSEYDSSEPEAADPEEFEYAPEQSDLLPDIAVCFLFFSLSFYN